MPLKYDFGDDCLGADDFKLTTFKGGGGKNKVKKQNEKKNPDGKYTSRHVRVSQAKMERSKEKRPKEKETVSKGK